MASTTTTTWGFRLENELLARLDALAARRSEPRTATAREALRLGLEQLQAQEDGQAAPAKGRARKQASPAAKPATAAPTPVQAAASAEPEADLPVFARHVLDSARAVPARQRFGDNRVFVSHVWKRFQKDHPGAGLDAELFKGRLLEANRARLLSLVCADMAPQMNQTDVQASEIRYLSATFHLLCI